MGEPTLDDLRRHAVARTLFGPATLPAALRRLGFVQADPIRAPARAQDLILRQRVRDYRVGDLERRYPRLPIEEDGFINYGFLPREHHALMHPRTPRRAWDEVHEQQAQAVLAFVRERGQVHPRDLDAHFDHGLSLNAWGGTGKHATRLLDGLHYRGLLRVARRDKGIRVYEAAAHVHAQEDSPQEQQRRATALLDLLLRLYAPLPSASLGYLVRLLTQYGAPHLNEAARAAVQEARRRWPTCRVDGTTWHWPEGENPASRRHLEDQQLRLLAPFDPIVWDRRRFTLLWGWEYRFEAYTPAPSRRYGYYALPVMWQGQVIGWANVARPGGQLRAALGYVSGKAPKGAAFRAALDDELHRLDQFLQSPGEEP